MQLSRRKPRPWSKRPGPGVGPSAAHRIEILLVTGRLTQNPPGLAKVTEAHTESSRVSFVPCSLGSSHRTPQVALLSEAHTECNDSGMTLGSHTDQTNRRDLEHTAGHWYFFQKISPEAVTQISLQSAQLKRGAPPQSSQYSFSNV